jgi:hypothetical protein
MAPFRNSASDPAVIRFSPSINPICTASLTKPPSELKKIGRSRFAKTAKNSRNRWAAPSSNLPSPAIHSVQPRPQAFGLLCLCYGGVSSQNANTASLPCRTVL